MHSKARGCPFELHTEVPLNRPKIISSEILVKMGFKLIEKPGVAPCEDNVVHIYQEGDCVMADVGEVEIRIGL